MLQAGGVVGAWGELGGWGGLDGWGDAGGWGGGQQAAMQARKFASSQNA